MPGSRLDRLVADLGRRAVRALLRSTPTSSSSTRRVTATRRRTEPAADDRRRTPGAVGDATYPGDFTGRLVPRYSPDLDGAPDPGEVVWTWVPYEEDHSRGKDRPVLLVGRDGPWLLGLMLSSRDHDARPDARSGRWTDIGSGSWDPRGRPSEVRVDRVVRVAPDAVRREGAVLPRAVFDAVVRSMPRPGSL